MQIGLGGLPLAFQVHLSPRMNMASTLKLALLLYLSETCLFFLNVVIRETPKPIFKILIFNSIY